jgi:hypothetical protein
MSKRCEDCIFAAYYKGYDKLWECRYHPPMPQYHPDRASDWRIVKNDFWCSKYESKTSIRARIERSKGVILETRDDS